MDAYRTVARSELDVYCMGNLFRNSSCSRKISFIRNFAEDTCCDTPCGHAFACYRKLGIVPFGYDKLGRAICRRYVRCRRKTCSPDAFYYIRQYYPEFIISIAAVFPIRRIIENIIEKHSGKLSVFVFGQLAPKAFAAIVFVLGYFKLVSGSFNPFIYFQF